MSSGVGLRHGSRCRHAACWRGRQQLQLMSLAVLVSVASASTVYDNVYTVGTEEELYNAVAETTEFTGESVGSIKISITADITMRKPLRDITTGSQLPNLDLICRSSVTIDGSADASTPFGHTVDLQNTGRFLSVKGCSGHGPLSMLIIRNLHITNGQAVWAQSEVSCESVLRAKSTGEHNPFGGAFYLSHGVGLKLEKVKISKCSAIIGGAIYQQINTIVDVPTVINPRMLEVTESVFEDDHAFVAGGSIASSQNTTGAHNTNGYSPAEILLDNSTFNRSSVICELENPMLNMSTAVKNQISTYQFCAGINGGAVYFDSYSDDELDKIMTAITIDVSNSKFQDSSLGFNYDDEEYEKCEAAASGGAFSFIFSSKANVRFTNCSFENSRSIGVGGVLDIQGYEPIEGIRPVMTLEACDFNNNRAKINDGDVVLAMFTELTIEGCKTNASEYDLQGRHVFSLVECTCYCKSLQVHAYYNETDAHDDNSAAGIVSCTATTTIETCPNCNPKLFSSQCIVTDALICGLKLFHRLCLKVIALIILGLLTACCFGYYKFIVWSKPLPVPYTKMQEEVQDKSWPKYDNEIQSKEHGSLDFLIHMNIAPNTSWPEILNFLQEHIPFIQTISPDMLERGRERFTGSSKEVSLTKNKLINDESAVATLKRSPDYNNRNDRMSVQSITKEIAILSSIGHPAVVRCYSVLESKPGFVMELIGGGTLSTYLENKGSMITFEDKSTIAIQIAGGLQYLHECNIIHMDLSLNNIMVSLESDDTLQVKIIDFGFSIVLDSSGDIIGDSEIPQGTKPFSAPEVQQAQRSAFKENPKLLKRVDVHSFGVILFHIWKGCGRSDELMSKDVRGCKKSLFDSDEEKESCPWANVIENCCAHNADDRRDISKVVEELERIKLGHTRE